MGVQCPDRQIGGVGGVDEGNGGMSNGILKALGRRGRAAHMGVGKGKGRERNVSARLA